MNTLQVPLLKMKNFGKLSLLLSMAIHISVATETNETIPLSNAVRSNFDGAVYLGQFGIRIHILENALNELTTRLTAAENELNQVKASAITNVRLGPRQHSNAYKGYGYDDTNGYVITGIVNFDKDEHIDYILRRPVELLQNGVWRRVEFE